jgi:hypothetical protein
METHALSHRLEPSTILAIFWREKIIRQVARIRPMHPSLDMDDLLVVYGQTQIIRAFLRLHAM